jgi:hypothetical protein
MLLHELIIDENNMGYIPSLGTSFQLNQTAREIITLIKQQKSKDEIAKLLAERNRIDFKDIYIDVEDFFQKLKVYGLIQ